MSDNHQETEHQVTFEELNLAPEIKKAVKELGYEVPSPIQAQSIPHMLEGHDILGQAQTGTGKTAAFALPILSNIDLSDTSAPQVLVLAPTRELAIQVAEAFQSYSRHLKGMHVLPIYGGSGYDSQLRMLKRGVHIVVGTPGRVMDHIKRKTLKLHNIKIMVLDEADEMLRMGFIEDVQWVLENTPEEKQIALFSATMPTVIRKVADQHLRDPKIVKIQAATTTNDRIKQTYLPVKNSNKLDALTRILETKIFDAVIIFVRTKNATVELAEKLEARGYSSAALNGDIAQNQRERTIDRLKKGRLDIVVATDVAARGIDVERVSLVVNYDIPYDVEAYTHRIGRTGRAGREGEAILFVDTREKRMLSSIERTTRQKMELVSLPSVDQINENRKAKFEQRITDAMGSCSDLDLYEEIIEDYVQKHAVNPVQVAAAMAHLLQGSEPMFLDEKALAKIQSVEFEDRPGRKRKDKSKRVRTSRAPEGMVRYRLAVGSKHNVRPGNIVGAIANEAGLDSKHIGPIEIYPTHSTVDLPEGMPKEVFDDLKGAWVCGQRLSITLYSDKPPKRADNEPKSGDTAHKKPRQNKDRKPRKRPVNSSKPKEGSSSKPRKK